MKNCILIVCGPSGAGKQTGINVVRSDQNPPLTTVSYTTRVPREGEVDGVSYHFVAVETFRKMIDLDEFVEWAEVHGNYYGTTKKELESKLEAGDVLFDVDYQGAQQIKRKYKDAITILVLPPKLSDLPERLRRRNESEESIQRRMKTAIEEIKQAEWFDYWIVNKDVRIFEAEFYVLIEDIRTYRTGSVIYQDKDELREHIATML